MQPIPRTIGRFNKYIKDFSLKINGAFFNLKFLCLINNEIVEISDGVDEGKTDEIVERVWLSLLAIARNSSLPEKEDIYNDLKRIGKDLGFVTPEERGR